MKREIISICEHPELIAEAAQWFSSKWCIPMQAYLDSMEEGCHSTSGVPAWYMIKENNQIIAGVGVIENDFHKRPDLHPNICAVYVEPDFRKQRIAPQLLDHACEKLVEKGIKTVYLLTNHTDLYERYGWQFDCMAECDDGDFSRVYRHDM